MNKKVLVLEDEDNIRAFVVINLQRAGYETVEFGLGEEAANYLKDNNDVSIAVLDVMLPDISGFDVCRRIRGMGSKIGIIMLTAMGQESDRVTGLMTGADDYVTKPFSVAELVARVDALYRQLQALASNASGLYRCSLSDSVDPAYALDIQQARELFRTIEVSWNAEEY